MTWEISYENKDSKKYLSLSVFILGLIEWKVMKNDRKKGYE